MGYRTLLVLLHKKKKTLTFFFVFVINCTVQPESVPGYCLLISHLSDFFVPPNVSHDVVNGPKKKKERKFSMTGK